MYQPIKKAGRVLGRVWSDSPILGTRAVRAGAITFFLRLLNKSIYLARTIILARLLFPEDFGLFGMAAIAIGLADTFFQSGLGAAVIQKKGNVEQYLDTVWTYNILKGAVLGIALWFAAPLVASFYNEPMVLGLMRGLAVGIFISGLENVAIILYQRDLAFNRKFFYDFGLVIADVAGVLIAAWYLESAWALVIGAVASRIAAVALSFLLHPYRPRLRLRVQHFLELGKFSRWIWVIGIATYLVGQGDSLVVGKILGSEQLGYYVLAFSLATIPAVEIARTCAMVLFPMFSQLQSKRDELRAAFLRAARLVWSITIPASVGLYILAPEIVAHVYGSRWLPMVPVLCVLIVFGALKSFEQTMQPLLLGAGRPRHSATAVVVQAIVMLLLIVPATTHFGLVGAGYAVIAAMIVGLSMTVFAVRREVRCSLSDLLASLMPALAGSAGMSMALAALLHVVEISSALLLVGTVIFGALTYFAALYGIDRLTGRQLSATLIWIRTQI